MIPEMIVGIGLVVGVPAGFVLTLVAGMFRIPWRHAVLIGTGVAVIIAALAIAPHMDPRRIDPAAWVLIGAVAGGVAVRAYERGIALRKAKIDRILSVPPAV